MEPAKSYTCARCRKTYTTGWSDAEAMREYNEHFGALPKVVREDYETVCDDCYRKFMKWMRAEFRKSGGKVTLKN